MGETFSQVTITTYWECTGRSEHKNQLEGRETGEGVRIYSYLSDVCTHGRLEMIDSCLDHWNLQDVCSCTRESGKRSPAPARNFQELVRYPLTIKTAEKEKKEKEKRKKRLSDLG